MRALARAGVVLLAVVAACRISDTHFTGLGGGDDGGGGGSDGAVADAPLMPSGAHAVVFTSIGSNGSAILMTRDGAGNLGAMLDTTPLDTLVEATRGAGHLYALQKQGSGTGYFVRAVGLGSDHFTQTADATLPASSCNATHLAVSPAMALVGCANQSFYRSAIATDGSLSGFTAQVVANANSMRGVAFSPSGACAYAADGGANMLVHAYQVSGNSLTELGSPQGGPMGVDNLTVDPTGTLLFAGGFTSMSLFSIAADCSLAPINSVTAIHGRILVDATKSIIYVTTNVLLQTRSYSAAGLAATPIDSRSSGSATDATLDAGVNLLYLVGSAGISAYHRLPDGTPSTQVPEPGGSNAVWLELTP